MNKLFVRLVASGTVALSVGAPAALADNVSIDTTGPGSTNVVTSRNLNSWCQSVLNRAELGNWNHQWAQSGNVRVWGNTKVFGTGM